MKLKWTIVLTTAALCIGYFVGRATKPQSGLDELASVAEKNHLSWFIGEDYEGNVGHVRAQLIKTDTMTEWSTDYARPFGWQSRGPQEVAKRVVDQFRNTPGREMVQHSAKAQPMVFNMDECVHDGTCVVDPTDSFYLATCTDPKEKPLRTDIPLTKQIVKCPGENGKLRYPQADGTWIMK